MSVSKFVSVFAFAALCGGTAYAENSPLSDEEISACLSSAFNVIEMPHERRNVRYNEIISAQTSEKNTIHDGIVASIGMGRRFFSDDRQQTEYMIVAQAYWLDMLTAFQIIRIRINNNGSLAYINEDSKFVTHYQSEQESRELISATISGEEIETQIAAELEPEAEIISKWVNDAALTTAIYILYCLNADMSELNAGEPIKPPDFSNLEALAFH